MDLLALMFVLMLPLVQNLGILLDVFLVGERLVGLTLLILFSQQLFS